MHATYVARGCVVVLLKVVVVYRLSMRDWKLSDFIEKMNESLTAFE